MCGIIGITGSEQQKPSKNSTTSANRFPIYKHNVLAQLLSSLQHLTYRGYDSAGISLLIAEKIQNPKNTQKIEKITEEKQEKKFQENFFAGHKSVGKIHALIQKLLQIQQNHLEKHHFSIQNNQNTNSHNHNPYIFCPSKFEKKKNSENVENLSKEKKILEEKEDEKNNFVSEELFSEIGIGHSRWATHGRVSEENAHPHRSSLGFFEIVHNGTIENFMHLNEKFLKSIDYFLKSQTDTEIIVALLEYYFVCFLGILDEKFNDFGGIQGVVEALEREKSENNEKNDEKKNDVNRVEIDKLVFELYDIGSEKVSKMYNRLEHFKHSQKPEKNSLCESSEKKSEERKNPTEEKITFEKIEKIFSNNIILGIISTVLPLLNGSFALCIMFSPHNQSIYATKRNSPLCVGHISAPISLFQNSEKNSQEEKKNSEEKYENETNQNNNFYQQTLIGSDATCLDICNMLYYLQDNDIAHCLPSGFTVFQQNLNFQTFQHFYKNSRNSKNHKNEEKNNFENEKNQTENEYFFPLYCMLDHNEHMVPNQHFKLSNIQGENSQYSHNYTQKTTEKNELFFEKTKLNISMEDVINVMNRALSIGYSIGKSPNTSSVAFYRYNDEEKSNQNSENQEINSENKNYNNFEKNNSHNSQNCFDENLVNFSHNLNMLFNDIIPHITTCTNSSETIQNNNQDEKISRKNNEKNAFFEKQKNVENKNNIFEKNQMLHSISKDDYYMLQEIGEQPDLLRNLIPQLFKLSKVELVDEHDCEKNSEKNNSNNSEKHCDENDGGGLVEVDGQIYKMLESVSLYQHLNNQQKTTKNSEKNPNFQTNETNETNQKNDFSKNDENDNFSIDPHANYLLEFTFPFLIPQSSQLLSKSPINLPSTFSNSDQKNISEKNELFKFLENINIIACGSSYHAGFAGRYLLEAVSGVKTSVEIASEYIYRNPALNPSYSIRSIFEKNNFEKNEKNTKKENCENKIPFAPVLTNLNCFISQSGETSDTISAVQHTIKNTPSSAPIFEQFSQLQNLFNFQKNIFSEKNNFCEEQKQTFPDILSLVNVDQSTLARNSHFVLKTQAGVERAVASTKAFTLQFFWIFFLSFEIAKQKDKFESKKILSGKLFQKMFFSSNPSQFSSSQQIPHIPSSSTSSSHQQIQIHPNSPHIPSIFPLFSQFFFTLPKILDQIATSFLTSRLHFEAILVPCITSTMEHYQQYGFQSEFQMSCIENNEKNTFQKNIFPTNFEKLKNWKNQKNQNNISEEKNICSEKNISEEIFGNVHPLALREFCSTYYNVFQSDSNDSVENYAHSIEKTTQQNAEKIENFEHFENKPNINEKIQKIQKNEYFETAEKQWRNAIPLVNLIAMLSSMYTNNDSSQQQQKHHQNDTKKNSEKSEHISQKNAIEKNEKIEKHPYSLLKSTIILGRGYFFPIALECALKLKELTYLSVDGIGAGELKHGPLSLVDSTVLCIVLCPFFSHVKKQSKWQEEKKQDLDLDEILIVPNPWFSRTCSNIQEIIARNGNVIVITDDMGFSELQKFHFSPPKKNISKEKIDKNDANQNSGTNHAYFNLTNTFMIPSVSFGDIGMNYENFEDQYNDLNEENTVGKSEKSLKNFENEKKCSEKTIEKKIELFEKEKKAHFDFVTASDLTSPFAITMMFQYITYFTALYMGKDVDQPRNLAKSVTVE